MKRPVRQSDGHYHIDGKHFKQLFGSRQQVWNGTAYKTEGLLLKKDIMMNKWGRLVSKKKHATAKKEQMQKKGLFKNYTAVKGKFGSVKRETRSKK
jgi:hypothetical protein